MPDDHPELDLTQLVAEYHEVLYRYAYRLTGSVHDAEDLTQQVFLAAQRKLGQVRDSGKIRSWLFSVLRNGFLKSTQKKLPVPAGNLQLSLDTIPAQPPVGDTIDKERLQRALGELPETFRVVVVMFYFEECSYIEIAEQLEVPIGTVMSRLARAKAHLRSKLFEPDHHRPSPQKPDTAQKRG